jgi:hypothetical protein
MRNVFEAELGKLTPKQIEMKARFINRRLHENSLSENMRILKVMNNIKCISPSELLKKYENLIDLNQTPYYYLQCYDNSFLNTVNNHNIKFILGIVNINKMEIIAHAWNKYNNDFFDITFSAKEYSDCITIEYYPLFEIDYSNIINLEENVKIMSNILLEDGFHRLTFKI